MREVIRSNRIHEDIADVMEASHLLHRLAGELFRELREDPYATGAVGRQYATTLLTRAAWRVNGLEEPYDVLGYLR